MPPRKHTFNTTLPKKWHNFLIVEDGHAVLCGHYNQHHRRYKGITTQGPAVAMMACCYARLFKTDGWTENTLDEILQQGTELYKKTIDSAEKKCIEQIEPPDICRYFFIGDNYITMCLGTDRIVDKLHEDSHPLDELAAFIRKFFTTNEYGIFASQGKYFAIWHYGEDGFFVFDPLEHEEDGTMFTGIKDRGRCVAMRFKLPLYLAEFIYDNINIEHITKFVLYPCEVEKVKSIERTPPIILEPNAPIPLAASSPKKGKHHKKLKKGKGWVGDAQTTSPFDDTVDVTVNLDEDMPNKRETDVPPNRIPPERPKIDSITNFQIIIDNCKGILRASTHQQDPMFSKYGGTQELANGVAALTMLRVHKSKRWTRSIVDDILVLAEQIHHDALQKNPYELPDKITYDEKHFTPKFEKLSQMGRLQSVTDEVLDLLPALNEFLADHDCCILLGPIIVAIWVEDGTFYMYDPNERNGEGQINQDPNNAGTACVTFYKNLNDLVEIYFDNLPMSKKRDCFQLCKVVIKDYKDKAEDWNNFRALGLSEWILRGTFSQNDPRFDSETRNTQCTANAAMALAYSELKEEKDWDHGTMDAILLNGDEYYKTCLQTLQDSGRFKSKKLMADELVKQFPLENKQINLEIDDCLVNGIINARSDTGVPNLRRGFEEFFLNGDAGIVTANLLSMAVWKRDNAYFYFDSHSRNDKGLACAYGTSCLLRVMSLTDLSNYLSSNFGADSKNFYNISRIIVRLIETTEEGIVLPPLNAYEALTEYKAIIRSNFSECSEDFDIRQRKQSVPMCMLAFVLDSMLPSFLWSKELLDQVLKVGDLHYMKCMIALRSQDEQPVEEGNDSDDITTNNLIKEITLGTNKFSVEYEDYSQGNYKDNLKEALEGLLIEEEPPERFRAMLESSFMTVAIWRDENLFYLFDPKPRDPSGQVYGKDDWSLLPPEEEFEEVEGEELGEGEEYESTENDEGDEEKEQRTEELEYSDENKTAVTDESFDIEEQLRRLEEEIEEDNVDEEDYEDDYEWEPVEKKGSEYWRNEELNGKACVMRFSKLDDLIQHIIENSPPTKRQELEYSLKRVNVTNTSILHEVFDPENEEKKDEWVGNWHNFAEIDYGKWILRGTKTNEDAMFLPQNRTKQTVPMCMSAIIFANVYALSKFTVDVVDMILMYGDRLYSYTRRKRVKELLEADLSMTEEDIQSVMDLYDTTLVDYPTKICIAEKLATLEVILEVVKGDLTSKNPEEVPDLNEGLRKFFESHNHGVLDCKKYTVAVWKSGGVYYMFDCLPRGPNGHKEPIGVACITRYKELEDLVKIYTSNVPKIGFNIFLIHAIKVAEDTCNRERQPEEHPKKIDNLGGFELVVPGKEILRGTTKEPEEKFLQGSHIHSTPIALVTLALSLIQKPETWTQLLVNEMLRRGRELYEESIEQLGEDFNPWTGPLDVYKLNTDFQLGRLKANYAYRFMEQSGIVDIKNSPVLNLRQGIEEFFLDNSHGILYTHNLALALWEEEREDDVCIYVFDPNQRGPTGLPMPGGRACVMKFCNAKMAADHLAACMMGVDKNKMRYEILPVEIVVGSYSTKRKARSLHNAPDEKQDKRQISPLCPTKAQLLEQKRMMRRIATEERRKKQEKRQSQLGRTGWYKINDEESILRGCFSLYELTDIATNIVTFIMMRLKNVEKWTCQNIDLCLKLGDQYYIDSFVAYKPNKASLELTELLRKFYMGKHEIEIGVIRPIPCGAFTAMSISLFLGKYFQYENFCLLNYREQWVSIYFKSGYYYYFDPYKRDLTGNRDDMNGTAVLMRYGDLNLLGGKIYHNLYVEVDAGEPQGEFFLVKVFIKNVAANNS